VVEKIVRCNEALGGISRTSFQMKAASLRHVKIMRAIKAIGTRAGRCANDSPIAVPGL
jgi:hypothetical protein